jgi:hypothetical protein
LSRPSRHLGIHKSLFAILYCPLDGIVTESYTQAFGKGRSESTPKEGGKDAAGEGEALLGMKASNAEEGLPKNIEEEGRIPLQELRGKEDREVVNYGATAETVKQV